jgi:hypothetical protein
MRMSGKEKEVLWYTKLEEEEEEEENSFHTHHA